jgi:RNA polymerase sigma-32 factor
MRSLSKSLSFAVPLGDDAGLKSYLRQIRDYPLLDPAEEQRLAWRWVNDHDVDAAHALVTSHLRLAAKIAGNYRGYGLPADELISEANVGLMQAVERFDPARGFRLATYAMWWIRAAIQEYVLQSWSLVRLGTTANQKKLFFNLRRLKGQIQAYAEGDLSDEAVRQIAERLRVSAAEVVSMNRRLAGPDRSLNAPVHDDGESEAQDWLVDDSESQESQLARDQEREQHRRLLAAALSRLSSREQDIVRERRLREAPLTLSELADRHNISRERVRQLEVSAVEKLKQSIVCGGAALETMALAARDSYRAARQSESRSGRHLSARQSQR